MTGSELAELFQSMLVIAESAMIMVRQSAML